MASIHARNGNAVLQLNMATGRHTVTLGPLSEDEAAQVRLYVERLIACHECGIPPDPPLLKWLASTGGKLRETLASAGIAPADYCANLGEYLDHVAVNTARKAQVADCMLALWNPFRPLYSLTERDGRQLAEGLTGNTNTRRSKLSAARTLLAPAVRRGILSDPFAGLPTAAVGVERGNVWVSQGTIEHVTRHIDHELRMLVALSRYGGLRTPVEALRLTRDDIQWDTERMRVRGKGDRVRFVPLFPEVRDVLVREQDPVIKFRRDHSESTRALKRAIRDAGLTPWPRLWHSLRASRQTELIDAHPIHVVCQWMGNSPAVGMKHYLQVRESDFRKAVQSGPTRES